MFAVCGAALCTHACGTFKSPVSTWGIVTPFECATARFPVAHNIKAESGWRSSARMDYAQLVLHSRPFETQPSRENVTCSALPLYGREVVVV